MKNNTVSVMCSSFHLTSFAVLVDIEGAQARVEKNFMLECISASQYMTDTANFKNVDIG